MIFWPHSAIKHAIRRVFIAVLSVSMIGCATIPAGTQPSAQDPWESFNRSVFSFNEGLDTYVLKPVTTGYRYVVPSVARDGIDDIIREVLWIRTRKANTLDARDGCNAVEQLGKGASCFQTFETVGVDGLPEEADFLGAVLSEVVDFGNNVIRWAGALLASGMWDDTEGAELVAAVHD